jgi:hypothetical protein
MNCLEFRRAVAVQPRALDAQARQHREECPRCAKVHGEALRFEALLDRSLAIAVPVEMPDRILLNQTTQTRRQSSGRRALVWRIAAGLALAVGIGGVTWLALVPRETLAAMSVDHLRHEPMALTAQGVVSGVQVRDTFQRLGVALQRSPGDISYLQICPLGLKRSLHMVMQRPAGAVTVMFVPGATAARRDFAERDVLGREVSVGGGVLLMLASSRSDFDAIEAGFRAAL